MDEITWLLLAVWLILVILSYTAMREVAVRGFSSVLGFFFCFEILSEATYFTAILLIFNFYLLYTAIFEDKK